MILSTELKLENLLTDKFISRYFNCLTYSKYLAMAPKESSYLNLKLIIQTKIINLKSSFSD